MLKFARYVFSLISLVLFAKKKIMTKMFINFCVINNAKYAILEHKNSKYMNDKLPTGTNHTFINILNLTSLNISIRINT